MGDGDEKEGLKLTGGAEDVDNLKNMHDTLFIVEVAKTKPSGLAGTEDDVTSHGGCKPALLKEYLSWG